MNDYKTFETERLLLKPVQLEDAAFLLKLLNSPKWIQFIGERNVKTIAEAKTYISERMLPQLQELGYGNYTVIRKLDNVKMGTCGLYNREGLDGIDIGFAFLPEFEKQGFAFESAHKILKVGFNEFNISKVSAITVQENLSSQKLIKKLGLKFKKVISLPNDSEELLLYSIKK